MKTNIVYLSFLLIGLTGCGNENVKTSSGMDDGVVAEAKSSDTAKQQGTDGVLFISSIGFNKDADIREAVRNDCKLENRLTQSIESFASKQFTQIETSAASAPKNAKILSVEIEEVQGGGGGAWSGAKSVSVNGKLTQNGKELGSFKGRRYSGGGMFAIYKGTCGILARCTKTLGKDISTWLKNPEKNSALGDL